LTSGSHGRKLAAGDWHFERSIAAGDKNGGRVPTVKCRLLVTG
jgi:hypothetical protein